MMSNQIHKKLVEDSQKLATLQESKRFSVHFDYEDLCNRLRNIKYQKGSNSRLQSSLQLNINQIIAENSSISANKKTSIPAQSTRQPKKAASVPRKNLVANTNITSTTSLNVKIAQTDSKPSLQNQLSARPKPESSKSSISFSAATLRRRVSCTDKTSNLFSPRILKNNVKK
jgi:hypothetical protein